MVSPWLSTDTLSLGSQTYVFYLWGLLDSIIVIYLLGIQYPGGEYHHFSMVTSPSWHLSPGLDRSLHGLRDYKALCV